MADGKNLSAWVTGDLLDRAERRAEKDHSGNTSQLMKAALADYLAGAPTPSGLEQNVIVTLARSLCGDLDAETIAERLAGVDQRRVLQAILRDLATDQLILDVPGVAGTVLATRRKLAEDSPRKPARRVTARPAPGAQAQAGPAPTERREKQA